VLPDGGRVTNSGSPNRSFVDPFADHGNLFGWKRRAAEWHPRGTVGRYDSLKQQAPASIARHDDGTGLPTFAYPGGRIQAQATGSIFSAMA